MQHRHLTLLALSIITLVILSSNFYQMGQAQPATDDAFAALTETAETVRETAYLEATAVVQLTRYPETMTAWALSQTGSMSAPTNTIVSETPSTNPDVYATTTRLIAQLTTSPTPSPTVYSTPIPTPIYCGYAFTNWSMSELSAEMTDELVAIGYNGHVSAFTFEAENITETCERQKFINASIRSRFTVVTQATVPPTQDEYAEIFEDVFELALGYAYEDGISVSDLSLHHYHEATNQTRYLCTDFRTLEVAYFLGARGDNLLNAAMEHSCE